MPIPADPSPTLSAYAHPERLVTADWLSANLGTPGLVIVESDEDVLFLRHRSHPGRGENRLAYRPERPRVRDYIDGAQFADLMNRKGISRDDTVVIYGDKSNWWAAYALWVFTLFGHQDVRLLNGGRDLWIAEGRISRSMFQRRRAVATGRGARRRTDPGIQGSGSELLGRIDAHRRTFAAGIHR